MKKHMYNQVLRNNIEHVAETYEIKGVTEYHIESALTMDEENIDYSNYNNQLAELLFIAQEEK